MTRTDDIERLNQAARLEIIQRHLRELRGAGPVGSGPFDPALYRAREIAAAGLEQCMQLKWDVSAALLRLEGGGDYGYCEACLAPIEQDRLDAEPWARLCPPCHAQEEACLQTQQMDLQDAALPYLNFRTAGQ